MNDPLTVIPIPKITGTHGDVFAAVGLADLIAAADRISTVRIVDKGHCFEIVPSEPLDDEIISSLSKDPGYPYLITSEKGKIPPGALDAVHYEAEKAKMDRQKAARQAAKKGSKASLDAESFQQIQAERIRDDWRLLQVLNILQGDETANKLYATILSMPADNFLSCIRTGLAKIAKNERSGIDWSVSSVQLYTPSAAKGYCRLKPDKTDRNDKTKEQWVDPLMEWFKYRGYFHSACPFFVGSKGENIRLLAPIPADISIQAYCSVVRQLRKLTIFGGAPKVDSLSTLSLADILIRHCEEFRAADVEIFPGISLIGKSPAQIISALAVTQYQSMGTSKAITSMSTLAVPGWFPINGPADASQWLEILSEHQAIIRGLKDDHSDEIGLLIRYRRFLEQRGELSAFRLLEFMEHYGPFLMRAREPKRRLRQFRTDFFGRVIMAIAPSLTDILRDTGFVAVATAVRKATVSAQALKTMQKDYREIRYELLHDLRRTRALPGKEAFVQTVSDFVSKYNSENARRREMKKEAPRNVTTEEFESFVGILDRYSVATVGAMLCAYGSCRESREKDPISPDEAEVDTVEESLVV